MERWMHKEYQQANFEHLLLMVKHQQQVRNCEVEGSVYGIEKDLETVHDLGLISMSQLDELLEVIEKSESEFLMTDAELRQINDCTADWAN